MKKSIVMAAMLGLLTVSGTLPAFAAWKQDDAGKRWWYENADGSYTRSGWQVIDGKWYYFDAEGWMLSSATTPDGYTVNADGQWIKDDVVQTVSGSTAASSVTSSAASSTKKKTRPKKPLNQIHAVKGKNPDLTQKTSGPIKGSTSSEDFDAFQKRTDSNAAASVSTEETD